METLEQVETLEAYDGLELHCQVTSAPSIQGIVIALHDYGEHCGVYQTVFQGLVQAGFKVYAQDLRGHGKSAGDKARIKSFDDFLEDLDLLLARVSDREALFRDRVFIMGHGLGALIAARFVGTRKPRVRGLILGDLLTHLPLTSSERRMLSIPGPWLEYREIGTEVRQVWLHHKATASGVDDPLLYRGPITLGVVREVLGAFQKLYGKPLELSCALLVLQGESPLSEPARIQKFYQAIDTYDKTFLDYSGGSHKFLLCSSVEKILGDIVSWCGVKLNEPSPVLAEEEEDEDD